MKGGVVYARYTPELGREICTRIAGGELWTHMAGRGRMPRESALYAWRNKHPAFAEALAQAREIAAEGRGGLPSNLHLLEEDLMKDEPITPVARLPRRKSQRPDGGVAYVRYGPGVVREICNGLAAGKTWRSMCNLRGMPSHATFYDWRRKHPEFDHAVRVARSMAAEDRFEQAYEAAVAAKAETIHADKLLVETCMKQAAALDPSQFSERRREAPDDSDGGHIQTIVVRSFERVYRDDGTSYIDAIDDVQRVER